jgi:uncharacterized protein YndB with AHSA1/START domain
MVEVTTSGTAQVTLPTDEEILITREFAAPPRLLWKAWTTPEIVSRWWSGQRGKMTSAEIDLRVGGRWRYVMVANEGFEVAFHGDYQEIVPQERIVTTEVFEGAPEGEPALNIVEFVENGDGTTLSLLARFESKAVRDYVLGTGMEGGMQEQMDLLDEIAASLE